MNGHSQTIQEFHAGILAELLEGAEFMYSQRAYLLDAPDFAWSNIKRSEDRLATYLRGLMIGGDQTLDLCDAAVSGEPGELHAACRIFIRCQQMDRLLAALDEGAKKSTSHLRACADALCLEPAGAWAKQLLQEVTSRSDTSHASLALFIGTQRIPVKTWLLNRLSQGQALAETAWALGRLPASERSIEALRALLLTASDSEVKTAAAIALARLHDRKGLAHVAAQKQSWAALPLALAWGKSAAKILLGHQARRSPDAVLALGITGDASVVEALIALVARSKVTHAAELALYRLTGTDLRTPPRVEAQDDELFPHELPQPEKPTAKELAAKQQQSWQAWWTQNAARFDPKVRYLFGAPYSPAGLVECLKRPKLERQLRQWAYEGLVIRYRASAVFETDLLVKDQEQSIEALSAWAASHAATPGRWYFGGEVDNDKDSPATLAPVAPKAATPIDDDDEEEEEARFAFVPIKTEPRAFVEPQARPVEPHAPKEKTERTAIEQDLFKQATAIRAATRNDEQPWDAPESDERHLETLIERIASAARSTLPAKIESESELYVALRVLRRKDDIEGVLAALDTAHQSASRITAAAQALSDEPDGAWRQELMKAAVSKGHAPLALFVGMQRVPVKTWLLNRLERSEALEQSTWALGRLPASERVLAPLHLLLGHSQVEVRRTAMHSLLRLHDRLGLPNEIQRWSALPAALSGGEESVEQLFQLGEDLDANDPQAGDFILALGVCGSPRLIPIIATALGERRLAAAATQAMFRLTGNSNAHLDPDTRYLFGEPYSPAGLVQSIARPDVARPLRQLSYEELVIRHGIDAVFETTLSVKAQRQGIADLRAALDNVTAFRSGGW